MKKIAIFALAVILVAGLCACNMGTNEPTVTTPPTTLPATTPPTSAPADTEPIIDPTLDTNIPDPSVDNEHLTDPTDNTTAIPSPNE